MVSLSITIIRKMPTETTTKQHSLSASMARMLKTTVASVCKDVEILSPYTSLAGMEKDAATLSVSYTIN